jgi:hypothetical protein
MEQYQQFDPFKFLISEHAGHQGACEGMALAGAGRRRGGRRGRSRA